MRSNDHGTNACCHQHKDLKPVLVRRPERNVICWTEQSSNRLSCADANNRKLSRNVTGDLLQKISWLGQVRLLLADLRLERPEQEYVLS